MFLGLGAVGATEEKTYRSRDSLQSNKVFTNMATWPTPTCRGGRLLAPYFHCHWVSRSVEAESRPKLLVLLPSITS